MTTRPWLKAGALIGVLAVLVPLNGCPNGSAPEPSAPPAAASPLPAVRPVASRNTSPNPAEKGMEPSDDMDMDPPAADHSSDPVEVDDNSSDSSDYDDYNDYDDNSDSDYEDSDDSSDSSDFMWEENDTSDDSTDDSKD